MRLFALSDLHVDFAANAEALRSLAGAEHRGDALIVAGDVAHRLELVRDTLGFLRACFARVFYVPGNHEVWVWGSRGDSLVQFHRVLEACRQVGVHTSPAEAAGHWVVPLFSWYDASLADPVAPDAEPLQGWADLRRCRWPDGFGPPAEAFAAMNRPRLIRRPTPTVSFSHFLPRRELIPPRTHLHFPDLPQVAGSRLLEAQVRALGAQVHVYGHAHIRRDVVLDGVRYVEEHLGYPRERRGLPPQLKRIA
ncbi:MAG: metallophosphoesterase [Candidatus Latescibacterota bacterium]